MTDGVVICKECFDMSDHRGHRVVRKVKSIDGTCDCGDADLLKPQGFCKQHTGVVPDTAVFDSVTKARFIDRFKRVLYIAA